MVILHTGDVHLGKRFRDFGDFGKKLRKQVRETLGSLLRQAAREAEVLLIAGDLFDSNEPDPIEVREFLKAVRQAAPLPVCVLPGTHDRYSGGSVYRRAEFGEGQRPPNLHLFNQDGPQHFLFRQLSLAVHGRANLTNRGGQPPLKDIRPHPDARFNVALAHASVPLPQFEADDDHDYFVRPEEAAASGMDYIALAHWHRFGDCFGGEAPATFYCGSPEAIEFVGRETRGSCARVQLGDGPAAVSRIDSGHFTWRLDEIDATGQEDDEAVRTKLESLASPQTILCLRVTGRAAAHYRVPVGELEEEFAEKFAHLEVRDETARDVPWEELAGRFIPGTVGDFFCRAAEEKMRAASPAERAHWQEVLRRGSALLLDKEGVRE